MNETKQYGIKPYARLLTMLGDQLISSERVALVELVKNSYDADASWVKISFNNFEEVLNENHKRMDIKKTPSSSITIEEDGCGMSQDIILKHWLNPATPEKKNRKTAKATTPKGRLIQGEKGIGRFAIFKLGKKIKIITRSDKQNTFSESVIQYDFSGYNEDFVNEEGRNLMLDEIRVQVGERIPELFVERNVQWDNSIHVVKPHGTFIEISDLKGDWNLNKIREISYDFSCLQSIFDEKKDEQLDFGLDDGNSFSVKIFINQQQERDENDPHEALMGLIQEKAVFKIIKGHFDDKKNRYSFTLGEKDHFKDQFVDLSNAIIMGKSIFRKNFGPHGEVLRERKITCGPFDFEFYIFDFTLKSTEEKGLNVDEKKSIRKHRIYLYRDGIRVYPYGDEKDDWLQIDMSRGTISSGEYLSNDQVVGCIKISQKNNPDLRDKTNREGLIQGTETSDFIALIQIFLKYVRDEIYGKQYLELKKEKRRNEIVEEKEVVNHFSDLRNAVGNNPKVLKVLNETEVLYNKELSYYNERLKTTEDLAGVGLSVETASHDIMAFMSQVINNLSALLKDISNQEPLVSQ